MACKNRSDNTALRSGDTRRTSAGRVAAALLIIGASLAACDPPQRDAPQHDTTALSGFSIAAVRDTSRPSPGSTLPILTAVRLGRHDGFERIAFEFRGGTPGYRAEYLDGPVVTCAKGDTIAVEGSAVLAISFTPSDAHEFDGEQARSSIPERTIATGTDFSTVRQLKLTCDFEAEVAWAIGVTGRRPIRIVTLRDRGVVAVDLSLTLK